MEIKSFSTYHLIKSEDLNHHGTLFAGRSAEWFVEAGFVAAASIVDARDVICLKIHGMQFTKPMKIGQIACYTSRIVYAGKSSLVSHTKMCAIQDKESCILEGFLTFVHVDSNNKPKPHGVTMSPATDEEKQLYEEAKQLAKPIAAEAVQKK